MKRLDTSRADPPADYYFSLSYASWLVLPRLMLQNMPIAWQEKFFALVKEIPPRGMPDDYQVTVRGKDGKFRSVLWGDYRRGNIEALTGENDSE